MPRHPKPWYWQARRCWCVTLHGVRHNLGPDKAAAFDQFHRLMTQPKEKRVVRGDSLVAIIDAFLEWSRKHRSPHTYEWYRYRLQRFAEIHPHLNASQLRPFHVQEWLNSLDGLSSGSRRNHCRAIKRTLQWAFQQGYVDHNPIAHLEQPAGGKREQVISPAEFETMLTLIPDQDFRDLLLVTWETGCRPQESLGVEARHVDLTHSRWVFPQTESKGGIPRIVYLTGSALDITRRRMARFAQGKLFRNSNGQAWTTDAVNCAFIRLQIKMGRQEMQKRGIEVKESAVRELARRLAPTRLAAGVPVAKSKSELFGEARRKLATRLACSLAQKYSLYALRHSWATHALERGLDSLTVAVLMGHRDPSTLAKVYQHLSHSPVYLLEQAQRAVG